MGAPLFGRDDEIEALYHICHTCGSPNPDEWPEVTQLSGWESCKKSFKKNQLRETVMRNTRQTRKVASCT